HRRWLHGHSLFSLNQGSRRAVRCRVPAGKKRREEQGREISPGWPRPCGGLGHLHGWLGTGQAHQGAHRLRCEPSRAAKPAVRERMDGFRFNEKYLSQIPALQLLINLGYAYLTPEQALAARGGKPGQVL